MKRSESRFWSHRPCAVAHDQTLHQLVRAPAAGAFASDPYTVPPCEPNTGASSVQTQEDYGIRVGKRLAQPVLFLRPFDFSRGAQGTQQRVGTDVPNAAPRRRRAGNSPTRAEDIPSENSPHEEANRNTENNYEEIKNCYCRSTTRHSYPGLCEGSRGDRRRDPAGRADVPAALACSGWASAAAPGRRPPI
jgi:hypothetical protein